MLTFEQHQEGLTRRLVVIGIPHYALKPFVQLLVRWETCSGIEWTIGRLKSLKVDLIRRRSGLPPLTWVRKNRKGDVSGLIGSLFRWSDKSDQNFSRTIQAFMAYSFYILPSLTESQKEKFLSGINPEEYDVLDPDFLRSFGRAVSQHVKRRSVTCCHRPLVVYQGSPDKKAPTHFGRRSVPQDKEIWRDLELFNTDGGLYLYQRYKDLYDPLLVGLDTRRRYLQSLRDWDGSSTYPVYGGEIHFIQEPGGKLRSVASPFRIHQEALRPLGDLLYDVVRQLPWDCTHAQHEAIPHIQSHLWQGGQVHSVDLSSATDHFPLSLQEEALRAFIPKEDWIHIDLFVEISRGWWKSPLGDLQWTKGQPLGLYPSFASFTLTHGLLLFYLNGCRHDNQFFVVGDDVVILNDKLRDSYISMLDRMSCPWSEDKSISSNSLAEFAGKIVTKLEVIPQLKWRKMSNDNFLDICRLLGRKSRCLLSRRQKKVFDIVQHLVEPIGLNFSLPGDNLVKMIERTLDFYQPEKVVLGSLMGLRSRMNTFVYHSTEDCSPVQLDELSSTFDEKVKSVLSQTVFNRWESSISIGLDAFETLPEALGLRPRLPRKGVSSSRRTTLERYEGLMACQDH
jgi:hypothetical protein